MPTTQFPETISLSSLTTGTGFAVTGVLGKVSQLGYSVSGAGDLNNDGIADLVIGAPSVAPKGAAYVVFGTSSIGDSGSLSVSSLTGSNGFAISGFPESGNGGFSVSSCGDLNNDSIADLVIGAPSATSYVIFGKSDIGKGGTFDISTLTDSKGFTISGFPAVGQGGYSVSGCGDLNNDGISDLVIGAPSSSNEAGTSYVIFGKTGIGSSGAIDIPTLTGTNGFTIVGFPKGSRGGHSVSGCGDLNNDGIADLVIGAPYSLETRVGQAGTSYVIFGKNNIGSSGIFNISSLTGSNGFTITGFPADSNSHWSGGGWSVSGAGDVNNDGIADLVIGAPYAAASAGTSHVIFGKSDIGNSGIFDVSSLTGSNGFLISGFPAEGSCGGWSVSGAGDFNYDGIADLVVGAFDIVINNGRTGRSYVIFGRNDIGSDGGVDVSALMGTHGFIIMNYGGSVSGAGDINNDGIADLVIGAPGAAGMAGRSYAIFGDTVSALISNRLTITKGQTLVLTSNYLNATFPRRPILDSTIRFTLSAVQHGFFSLKSNPYNSITSFLQQQVRNNQVQFSHDDSAFPPSYSVQLLGDGGLATMEPQSASINFIHQGAVLVNNQLSISQGQTVTLFSTQLSANNLDLARDNPSLIFVVSNVQHGYFQQVGNPGISVTDFTQSELRIGGIQFVHDGSTNAPSYKVTVSDGSIETTPTAGTIFFNFPPILLNNRLIVNQGKSEVLTSDMISATDPDDAVGGLTFIISNVQHGQFELVNRPGHAITHFIQSQVQNGAIQFVHDNSIYAPSYSVAVSDGKITIPIQTSNISFNPSPILGNNKLTTEQGKTIVLDSNNLSATHKGVTIDSLMFIISNIKGGRFELLGAPKIAISSFTQGDIQAGAVKFIQNDSPTKPSYDVMVSDGRIITSPQSSTVMFNAAPVLIKNQLTITEADSHILTSDDLNAVDDHTASNELIFTASDVTHGHFEELSLPGTSLTVFAQQKISAGALRFVADGRKPHYNISVSDGSLNTAPCAASVKFSPSINASNHTMRDAIIGGAVSGAIGLGFFALKTYLERKAAVSLQTLVEGGKTEGEERLITFQREVLRPVAERLFKQIRTSNIIGYRSSEDTGGYITALESLLGRLVDLRVNLNIKEMAVAQQNRLFSEIVKQIREHVVKKYDCCTCGHIGSFFKVEMTPQMLENKLENIATSIAKAIPDSLREQSMGGDGIELKERKADRKVMEV